MHFVVNSTFSVALSLKQYLNRKMHITWIKIKRKFVAFVSTKPKRASQAGYFLLANAEVLHDGFINNVWIVGANRMR